MFVPFNQIFDKMITNIDKKYFDGTELRYRDIDVGLIISNKAIKR